MRDPYVFSDDGFGYWLGWESSGGVVEKDDGSLEVTLTVTHTKGRSFRFTLAEGKGRIIVPLHLDTIPLPR